MEVPTEDSALRHTGIRYMGDMPWATHVCLFYETRQDLLDTATCYFGAGLKSNELCIWAVSDPIWLQQAEDALRHAIPDFDIYRAAGQEANGILMVTTSICSGSPEVGSRSSVPPWPKGTMV